MQLNQLTPEQRAAILAMPPQLAERMIARMMGAVPPPDMPSETPTPGFDSGRGDYNAVGPRGFTANGSPITPPEFGQLNRPVNPRHKYNKYSGTMPMADEVMMNFPPPAPEAGFGEMPPIQAPPMPDPDSAFDPNLMEGIGEDPRGMWREGALPQPAHQPPGSFAPGAGYDVADMSNVPPSGVGETNQLNGTARSFQGFMASLADYEDIFKDGGATAWPGTRKDKLSIAHRDLQMQMKELYNLGVLNGPDLSLMNQILIDPTSISGNLMDAVGIADMEKRIPANIDQVRTLMLNRSLPALQQLGIDPDDLMPKRDPDQMSDEELLKFLTGG